MNIEPTPAEMNGRDNLNVSDKLALAASLIDYAALVLGLAGRGSDENAAAVALLSNAKADCIRVAEAARIAEGATL